MKSIKNIVLSLVAGFLMVACGTSTKKAPVEDRNPQPVKEQPTAPIAPPPVTKTDDTSTQYVVKKGDTLYRIALDKGQSYSDIVTWNNLANPNDIKVGQVLRVSPPDGAASGSNGVETRPVPSGSLTISSFMGGSGVFSAVFSGGFAISFPVETSVPSVFCISANVASE